MQSCRTMALNRTAYHHCHQMKVWRLWSSEQPSEMLWFRISIWFVWRSLQSHFPGNLNSYRKCRWCHCPVSHQATISRTTVYYECCWKGSPKKSNGLTTSCPESRDVRQILALILGGSAKKVEGDVANHILPGAPIPWPGTAGQTSHRSTMSCWVGAINCLFSTSVQSNS